MDKDTNPFLNSQWLQIQQQYLKTLSDLYQAPGSKEQVPDVQGGWNEALKTWA
jgi:hypothetical protein